MDVMVGRTRQLAAELAPRFFLTPSRAEYPPASRQSAGRSPCGSARIPIATPPPVSRATNTRPAPAPAAPSRRTAPATGSPSRRSALRGKDQIYRPWRDDVVSENDVVELVKRKQFTKFRSRWGTVTGYGYWRWRPRHCDHRVVSTTKKVKTL